MVSRWPRATPSELNDDSAPRQSSGSCAEATTAGPTCSASWAKAWRALSRSCWAVIMPCVTWVTSDLARSCAWAMAVQAVSPAGSAVVGAGSAGCDTMQDQACGQKARALYLESKYACSKAERSQYYLSALAANTAQPLVPEVQLDMSRFGMTPTARYMLLVTRLSQSCRNRVEDCLCTCASPATGSMQYLGMVQVWGLNTLIIPWPRQRRTQSYLAMAQDHHRLSTWRQHANSRHAPNATLSAVSS